MDIYMLLHLKWVTSKGLPCNIGLDVSGVSGRMDTDTCMIESFHCSPETITTLSVNQLYPNTK